MEVTGKSVINNKRIAKNTLFLYVRMLLMMFVNLYAVRISLKALGVEDYGIYNVVGSVVALCSFLTSSLTGASNRFFAREFVKNDKRSFNNCFCLNITSFGSLALIAIFILETVGLWYVNNKMVIPADRLFAANVVYQISIVSLALSFISIPYNALVITYEKMSVFAYIGITEALLRLGIAALILYSVYDRLIEYSILMLGVTVLSTLCYYIYCRKHYEESRYRIYWNRAEFKEIFSFVGWNFLGTLSFVIKSQGINILINAFFNPAVNAARAVAFQVESAIRKFSDGYYTATKPQIYKAWSNGEYVALNAMLQRTTIISVFLGSLFAFPVIFNTYTLLSLWLGDVPAKAVAFLQLVIFESILNSASEPVILTIVATGRQAAYQIVEFVLRALTIPFSYIILFYGGEPETTVVVCIVLSFLSLFARAYMLKRCFESFDIFKYCGVLTKILLSSAVVYFAVLLVARIAVGAWSTLILTTVLSALLLGVIYTWGIVEASDRRKLTRIVKAKILKRK